MLISSYELTNGIIITFLLLFCLELGLVCATIYRFVESTPAERFISFVQSVLRALRQGDENPNWSVAAEIRKLLRNSLYRYQILDCSRHSVTRYINDEKTHAAIKNKTLKRLGHLKDQLCGVELAKSETEHKEPIIVVFFNL